MVTKASKSKKKTKKNIPSGIAHINSTFNNTIVSIADTNGNVTAFSGTNVITGQTSSATGTPQNTTSTVNNVSFTSGYAAPELKHDTGEILYVENRTKIARATDQTENIKLIIEF